MIEYFAVQDITFIDKPIEERTIEQEVQFWRDQVDSQPRSIELEIPLEISPSEFYMGNKTGADRIKLNPQQEFMFCKTIARIKGISQIDEEFLAAEKVDPPNEWVLRRSEEIVYKLAEKNYFPNRVSTLLDEGLGMAFKNKDKVLYLELYNDEDSGFIVENVRTKQVIANQDFQDEKYFLYYLDEFFSDEVSEGITS